MTRAGFKLRNFTPAESRALEDHYIACAKRLGIQKPDLKAMDSQAKQANARKSERSQAAQNCKDMVLERLKTDEASISDLALDLEQPYHRTTYAVRQLFEEGKIVRAREPRGGYPALYRAAEEVAR